MPNISFDLLSQKLSGILADIPFKVCVGAELEFYLKGRELDVKDLVEELKKKYPSLEEERGWYQFENVFAHRFDILDLIDEIEEFKADLRVEARKYDCAAIFEPKPFEADYGSALHLHLSLHDEVGINKFADYEINENKHLQRTIAGVLEILEDSLYLICQDNDNEYERFDGRFMAPQNASWGGNNRSTSLRIPESEVRHRRLEFRVPSSNSNPCVSVVLLLLGVINGLEIEENSYPRIYGNAFDPQYELKSFPQNCSEAKKLFQNSAKVGTLITKYLGSIDV